MKTELKDMTPEEIADLIEKTILEVNEVKKPVDKKREGESKKRKSEEDVRKEKMIEREEKAKKKNKKVPEKYKKKISKERKKALGEARESLKKYKIFVNSLISKTCKKYNVNEGYIRKITGWEVEGSEFDGLEDIDPNE